jgi:hypothetical protein
MSTLKLTTAYEKNTEQAQQNSEAISTPKELTSNGVSPTIRNSDESRLLYNESETRQMLAGISRASLWRLEKRGLIKSIRWSRHKLYAKNEINRLITEGI